MAQLIQCDFCGTITNQIAAQVVIRPTNRVSVAHIRSILNEDYEYADQSLSKDCCNDCIQKFVSPKPVALAITPGGDVVRKEDL